MTGGRGSRASRRGAALTVLLLVGGVSAIAWRDAEQESTDTLGNGVTWAIWSGAAVLACLLAALVFRRDRELRIGILQGVALGLVAVVAVLWVGVAT